jgi:MYXO-CTERM domain-containing protein
MRNTFVPSSVIAIIAIAGVGQAAHAGWEAYRSGLVNAGPTPWQPAWPNYQYETFDVSSGSMSSGTLSQAVTTNADARATWYSFGYSGTNAQGQALTLGNSGLSSLSASVTVTGDLLQRVTGKEDAGYLMGDSLTSTTTGVAMAWYVMSQDSGGNWNIWLSNAANRLDLNGIRNGGASNFSVALDAANFQAFPGWPQGTETFAATVASAQYFGLLVTSSTASGMDFGGMKFDQTYNTTPGTGWNTFAIQRNGNYGAYSTGSSTISISNAVPAPGAIALLGVACLTARRRRH